MMATARGRRARYRFGNLLWGLVVICCASLASGCKEQWNRSYDPEGDAPHDLRTLPALLQTQWPSATYRGLESKALADLPVDDARGSVYFAIGDGLPYDSTHVDRLLRFVHNGGTAFLAAEELSIALPRALAGDDCLSDRYALYFYDEIARGDTALDSRGRRVVLDPVTRRVGYREYATSYVFAAYCRSRANVLIQVLQMDRALPPGGDTDGTYDTSPSEASVEDSTDYGQYEDDDYVDYDDYDDYTSDEEYYDDLTPAQRLVLNASNLLTEVPYGEGHVLLYSAPIMLTDAYIADSIGRPHITQVLSYLPADTRAIYFDVARRASAESVAYDNEPPHEDWDPSPLPRESILREVLKRPALATAWYLMLGAVLAFVLFGAKRRQRVVPVVTARRNTTLAYLGSVTRLYLTRPDNRLMARKQLAMFEAFCVRKFGLRPVRNPDDRRRLAELQGVDDDKVEALLRYQTTVDRQQGVSNDAFLRLVHTLNSLYRQLGRRSKDAPKPTA